ncbi:hypothetical protein BJN45_05670 [Azonexus hydrophilus]|uniref:DUF4325 domain-containing protein n=1 Tax=Azonexus hydrophilus TaxID=418702 RepID=A0A1R1I7G5_9RHOO|nr:DUF4325 domain-containing protein [Azonexus hydrophilus]OMG54698.1 hypothetical protein BJN45_05670 [Azonexus hydrophilus]
MSNIYRTENRIVFEGEFTILDLHRPLAAIHHAVQTDGYQDVEFDFSKCTAALPAPMLALCAQVARLQYAQIGTQLALPDNDKIKRLFLNSNWANIISPKQYDISNFRGHTQVPATQYKTTDEQFKAVNRIANAILGAIPDLERNDFAALEWSINELTDNVLVHSQSPVGGFVQVSTFKSKAKRLLFMVADAGVGIPTSLREGFKDITSDADALDRAIREGVTRDKSLGQGNGLFGSYQICSGSGGKFQLESGYGKLSYNERNGLRINSEKIPYEGTLVVAEINFSVPHLLEEALRFGGKKYSPLDHIEKYYEHPIEDSIVFRVSDETNSFGSRIAGTPLRKKLLNLAKMCPNYPVVIDFSDVALISSSFADELIAKLFVEVGAISFMSRFKFSGVSSTVKSLIDRAIAQRVAVGTTD